MTSSEESLTNEEAWGYVLRIACGDEVPKSPDPS